MTGVLTRKERDMDTHTHTHTHTHTQYLIMTETEITVRQLKTRNIRLAGHPRSWKRHGTILP